jgi:hypothetical protein
LFDRPKPTPGYSANGRRKKKKKLLYAYVSPAHFAFIYLEFVSPCIIIYSSKSTNQMHQSLSIIACRLNTATAVDKLLMMGMRMLEIY